MTASVVRNGAGWPVGGHGGRTAPPRGRDGRPALTTGGKCARGSGRRGEAAGDRVFMERWLSMGAFPTRRCGARPGFTRSPYNNPLRMTLVGLLGFRKKVEKSRKKVAGGGRGTGSCQGICRTRLGRGGPELVEGPGWVFSGRKSKAGYAPLIDRRVRTFPLHIRRLTASRIHDDILTLGRV